jgi:Flp pilus assembly protein TadG
MTRAIKLFGRKFRRGEKGTASVEFVVAVPVILTIFMASFEAGFFMIRSVMLEQAVDMAMRDVRLGHFEDVNGTTLKNAICDRILMFTNCEANMMIDMRRVTTDAWALPDEVMGCVNRSENTEPASEMQIGQQNEMILVRACIMQDAIFPSTGLALELPLDAQGGYALYSKSAYVVEPTS